MIRRNDYELDHRLSILEGKVANTESLQNQVFNIAQSVQAIAGTMEHMWEDQKDMKNDIKTLKEEPVKKWKDLGKTFVSTVVAGFATLVLGGFVWMFFQYYSSMVVK